jgi:hypothetical protein
VYIAGAAGDTSKLTEIALGMSDQQLVDAHLPAIDLSRLSGVVTGRGSNELKAANAPEELSLLLQTPDMNLSLGAESQPTRDTW